MSMSRRAARSAATSRCARRRRGGSRERPAADRHDRRRGRRDTRRWLPRPSSRRALPAAPQATGHGTAVASLIVGTNGTFRGAAPGASLLVADVYGGNPAAGSATGDRQGHVLDRRQAAERHQRQPGRPAQPDRRARNRRGAGRAGSRWSRQSATTAQPRRRSTPPARPESSPSPVSMPPTAPSPRRARPLHLDYSAPGADMAAALPGKGYANVRGTSFAAPFVSARLALAGSTAATGRRGQPQGPWPDRPRHRLRTCRVPPKRVGAK